MNTLRKILPLLLVLSLPAQAAGRHAPVPTVTPSPVVLASPTPLISPTPAPAVTGPIISVRKITGASFAEIKMIGEGVALVNQKISSYCFKEWVTAASYTENNGLTSTQIFDLIARNPVMVDVEMYMGDWRANHIDKTIGFEYDPFDGVVHINRYFVKTAYMVGDNLVHEGEGHSQGFHHYQVHSTSQPYGMNYAYEGCSNQQQQVRGAPAYKPPGIKIEIRKKKKK